tara:strand:- start:295 stop:468 length:174 start_codon:yes stop_codon:yes gene_type:complete
MARKKTKYKPPKADKEELEEFKEHIRTINEKSKAISEKYRRWWDTDKKDWKKGFGGH